MFIACFAMLCTTLSFGQDQVVLRGTVRDSTNKQVLSDVRVCINQDMVGVRNNASGEFQITVNKGSKVWFRKQGYRWESIIVTGNDVIIIDLPKSASNISNILSNNPNHEHEYSIDGVLIPKEEWNDVRLTENDIATINITSPKEGVMRFVFTTK